MTKRKRGYELFAGWPDPVYMDENPLLDPAAVERMISLMDPEGELDFTLPAQSLTLEGGGRITFFKSPQHQSIRSWWPE